MIDSKYILFNESNYNLETAVKKLDESGEGFIAIVKKDYTLIAILTDGDLRKALLKGQSKIENIINKNPITIASSKTYDEKAIYIRKIKRRHLPVVDKNRKLVTIFSLGKHRVFDESYNALIMAGGFGRRFKSLTKSTPKPMLKIGNRPIAELILISLIEHGFNNISISVHYQKDKIIEYFGDGSKYGIKINYLIEESPLGTAGCLSLFDDIELKKPLLVVNGDVITRIDYKDLLSYHQSEDALATMCVTKSKIVYPYGQVITENNNLIKIIEKPELEIETNCGIYVISKEIIRSIKKNTHINMINLFKNAVQNNQKVVVYKINKDWIDIGNEDQLIKAIDMMKNK